LFLCCACVLGVRVDFVLRFSGFKQVSPRLFRGPLGLSPTVAPEHLWVFPLGTRRCWSSLIGHSSLLVANAVPWGRVSEPAGLAPEALQECECSCRGFFASFLPVCEAFVSTGIGDVPAGLGRTRMIGNSRVRCTPGGVAACRAPEPVPIRGDRGELSVLFQARPRRLSAGRMVRFPQPPSIGLRIADSSSSFLWVVQVDAHAPFDKGRLVVRRLVHQSACVGLLGGARSHSLGTEGAEALHRWDPPD
jgi:hypothetical protein